MKEQNRILIVDDHPIVRLGMAQLINRNKDLAVCAEAGDAESAIQKIASDNPDLIVVDLSLEGTDGLELIKRIRYEHPSLPILAVSVHDELLYAERVLRAGGMGYVM